MMELSNVSRETLSQLESFSVLVEKWTARINLISKSSLPMMWERHIFDSAQLFQLAPSEGHWVDMGSGGGFPGIVAAILSKGQGASHQFTLIESDQRKCAFLRTAVREFSLPARVLSDRIEEVAPQNANILSARALADLSSLLGFGVRHMKPSAVALFPKGESWQKEVADARQIWNYDCDVIKSITNPAAAVLKIKDITRA